MAKKSDAVRVAEIQASSETGRQVVTVLTDPLWSSVLGFVAVHELRRADLVGPVADDFLYAGIIAINTNRAGLVKEAREGVTGILGSLGGGLDSLAKAIPLLGALS